MQQTKRFMAVLLCMVIAVSVAGCAAKEAPPADGPAAGGYTEDREVTAEDLAVFEAAMAETVGVSYEPTLVATQVVAGTNYRFTATATPVTPDAEAYAVYVYIYKPLSGEPELTEIVKAKAE